MAGNYQTFTPSATVTLGPVPAGSAGSVTLPTYDANNGAVLLQNTGAGTAFIVAGNAPGGSVSGTPGAIRLEAGVPVLLTNHPGFGGGTSATLSSGATVTFSRGSVAQQWLFPVPAAAVI